CYRLCGEKETVLLADRMRTLGYTHATKAGISIGIMDMEVPKEKEEYLSQAQKEVEEITNQYIEGLITDGERYNKVIDIWAKVTEEVAAKMMSNIGTEDVMKDGVTSKQSSFNPIFMMADSGARGSAQQIRQLAGMRGLMAKPSGEIIETPITSNFREGLSVLQYFISTHGARKGLADTALKTANSGYLTRRLVDVAQDAIITEKDCGTLDGITATALIEAGEVVEPLQERILGRTALDDIYDPFTDEVLVPANEEIDEDKAKKVVDAGVEKVRIRSVLSCQARRGVCVECYGRDLARGHKVSLGEAIGVIAAQSIGEPGTQLTMRTFHIGGAASRRAEQSMLESRGSGTVKYHNLQTVQRSDGATVVINRNGEIIIVDENGRERERYSVIYGAKMSVQDGETVEGGTLLAEWDPFAVPILTEVGGRVAYDDIVEGVTMLEALDEVTGLSRRVVIENKDPEVRPRISLLDESGTVLTLPSGQPARYFLPVAANISVVDGQEVSPGDVIARIPRETTKTKDITGGLPRVAELFEARKPKEAAVISEIEGVVKYGKDTKGKRKVMVVPDDPKAETREYLIPKAKHLTVQEGDRVRPGEALMDGAVNPHDILAVLGEKDLARYLVDEIQEVYRLQGVGINDKHIEVIVRQMLRRIRITDVGDTNFLVDEQVEKWSFEEENERVLAEGGRPAMGEPLLLGITKASLSTESFIAAASFQETTKVLTEAAISGRIDYLRGLKENVIMGRLIPAGTGLPIYKNVDIEVETPVDEAEVAEEILAAADEAMAEAAAEERG
ncbi:MAG: DNA-directed RNA polymerase subunit beta', partial [Myxococcota bacterium]